MRTQLVGLGKKKDILMKIVFGYLPYVHAYLHSKEIYTHLVKIIEDTGRWIIARVESRRNDEIYDVFIDFINDVYMCTCNAWTFKRYEIPIPEEYQQYFKKDTIAICPHILKVLEVYFNSLNS